MKPCLLLAATLLLLLSPAAAQPATDARPPRRIATWFVYENPQSIELLRPRARFLSSISVCGGADAAFIRQCHELGIKVHLLVGGHDGKAFATAEARRELIAGYVQRCRDTGADGIDLDFESLDRECRGAYSLLLGEAAEALHAAGKQLSMCVSYVMCTWRSNKEPAADAEANIDGGWYDPVVLGQKCDLVRVMCYDMISPSSTAVGPVSSAAWARDAMTYWGRFVPREKLVMGLPAYSRDYAMNGKRETGSLYRATPDVPEGHPLQCLWMPYEAIHQYRYNAPDGVEHVFFASDVASTQAHLQTAAALGLSQIGFWHYGAVPAETWAVVEAWLQGQP